LAKVPGLVLTESEVSQTIDLEKWTGANLDSDPELVREIGQAVVDYMKERVSTGKGVDRQTFKRNTYSKQYQQSLDFKAAGKSPSPVNMELSGDMLGSIDLVDNGSQVKIMIGGSEAVKAFAHQTGYEGHPTIPNGKYKREFFGITRQEFEKEILPKYRDDIQQRKVTPTRDVQREAINRIKASDFFQADERLDIALYRDLIDIIESEGE
jgi:hypothetical protein